MQRKHPTSYFLIVIGNLALGEERKPKNEVRLEPALIFFQRNFARVNSMRQKSTQTIKFKQKFSVPLVDTVGICNS